jgi:hypothetical protein
MNYVFAREFQELTPGSSDSIVDRPRAAKRLIAISDKRFG